MKKISVWICRPRNYDMYTIFNYLEQNHQDAKIDVYISKENEYFEVCANQYNFNIIKYDELDTSTYLDTLYGGKHFQEKYAPKTYKKIEKFVSKVRKQNYDEFIITELHLSRYKLIDPDKKSTLLLLPWRLSKKNNIYDSDLYINLSRFDKILTHYDEIVEDIKAMSNELGNKVVKIPLSFSEKNIEKFKPVRSKFLASVEDYWDWNSVEEKVSNKLYTVFTPLNFYNLPDFEKVCSILDKKGPCSVAYRLFKNDDVFASEYIENIVMSRYENISFTKLTYFNSVSLLAQSEAILSDIESIETIGMIKAIKNKKHVFKFPTLNVEEKWYQFLEDNETGKIEIEIV